MPRGSPWRPPLALIPRGCRSVKRESEREERGAHGGTPRSACSSPLVHRLHIPVTARAMERGIDGQDLAVGREGPHRLAGHRALALIALPGEGLVHYEPVAFKRRARRHAATGGCLQLLAAV